MLPTLSSRNVNIPEVSDLFDREFGRMMRHFWDENGAEVARTGFYPANLWEDDDNVYLEAEMPGFKRDEIDITLQQGVLTVHAERSSQREDQGDERQGNGSPLLSERRYMQYQRSFQIPAAVDEENVEARLEDGVLFLSMPKRSEVKPRRITVA